MNVNDVSVLDIYSVFTATFSFSRLQVKIVVFVDHMIT